MNIRVVKKNEYNAIRAFYHTLIDRMKDAEYKLGWEKEVYPSDAYLRESLENGDLWVYETDGGYAAAMILNRESNEGYTNIRWQIDLKSDQVFVIHALGVMPMYQRKGIAGSMVKKAMEIAQNENAGALRLDVLAGNMPAEKLYVKHGFRYIDTVQMFYEDTGWTNFKVYEYRFRQIDECV